MSVLRIAIAAQMILLTSCGGEGSSGNVPTPSPTPTATATATPTPAPIPVSIFDPTVPLYQASTKFATLESYVRYIQIDGQNIAPDPSPAPKFYSPYADLNAEYFLPQQQVNVKFREDDLIYTTSLTQFSNVIVRNDLYRFNFSGNGLIAQVDLWDSSQRNKTLQTSYSSMTNIFTQKIPEYSRVGLHSISYGIITTDSQIPNSGALEYGGQILGWATGFDTKAIYELRGTINVRLDASTPRAMFTIVLVGTDRYSGRQVTFDPITFDEPLTSSLLTRRGFFIQKEGIFYSEAFLAGPEAAELFGRAGLWVPEPGASDSQLEVQFSFVSVKRVA